jgi:hypothetical protein
MVTAVGGLLIHDSIIRPVVSTSTLLTTVGMILSWINSPPTEVTTQWYLINHVHCMVTSVWVLLIHESIIRPVVSSSTLTWFIRCHCMVTAVGGLLIHDSIIRPVVSTSTLTWFIRYHWVVTSPEISYKPYQCRGTDCWTDDTLVD